MIDEPDPTNWAERDAERQRSAIGSFPFPLVETTGEKALETWQSLRVTGAPYPVVIGDAAVVTRLVDDADISCGMSAEAAKTIFEMAAELRHPQDLIEHNRREHEHAQKEIERFLEQHGEAIRARDTSNDYILKLLGDYLPTREWPDSPPPQTALSVTYDILTRKPLDRVFIALVPTSDGTEVPAYFRWGNWNGCPAPQFHVAALRSWRDRYGAELVSLGADVMDIRVARRPETPDAAMALAREHYEYCNDIVDQGTGTISELAAMLMDTDWWYFWWD